MALIDRDLAEQVAVTAIHIADGFAQSRFRRRAERYWDVGMLERSRYFAKAARKLLHVIGSPVPRGTLPYIWEYEVAEALGSCIADQLARTCELYSEWDLTHQMETLHARFIRDVKGSTK